MPLITTHEVVLQRLALGHVLMRDRDPMNPRRWRVRFDTTVVEDRVVRQLLEAGLIEASHLQPDGQCRYVATAKGLAGAQVPTGDAKAAPAHPAVAAGRSVDIRGSHRYVLQLFRVYGPMTTAELEQAHRQTADRNPLVAPNFSASRLRSACPELERMGLLRRHGTKPTGHTTTTGVPTHAVVWTTAEEAPTGPAGDLGVAAHPTGDAPTGNGAQTSLGV